MPGRSANGRNILQNFSSADQDRRWNCFNYTALRPQLVTGPTPGALNVLPAIGVYAAMRREKGEAFGFPGGPSFVWEAADADLVAEVMVWAAQSPGRRTKRSTSLTATCSSGAMCGRPWLKPSV
jgi:nucleoside-diphosphate-sugar epimerase